MLSEYFPKRSTRIINISGCLVMFLFLITFLSNGRLLAQIKFPSGATLIGDSSARREIINILRDDSTKWESALKIYFGSARDPRLPDLVVFIDSSENIRASMIQGTKNVKILSGQQKFWVIVFSEKCYPEMKDTEVVKLKTISRGKDTTTVTEKIISSFSLEVKRETLQYVPGPATGTILGMLEAVVGKITSITPAIETNLTTLGDSDITVTMNFLGDVKDSLKSPLYVGNVGFSLAPNTYVRVIVRPSDPKKFRTFHKTFVNTEGTYFSTSVGVSYGPWDPDTLRKNPSVLLLGHFNLIQPRTPVDSRTVSIALGLAANNSSDLFSKFFFGGRVSLAYSYYVWNWSSDFDEQDNIFGNSGLLLGLVFGSHMKPSYRIGLDIML